MATLHFALVSLVISITDLATHRISRTFTFASFASAFLTLSQPLTAKALAPIFVMSGISWVMWRYVPGVIGRGDLRLFPLLGIYCTSLNGIAGAATVALTVLLSLLSIMAIFQSQGRNRVAFAPILFLVTLVSTTSRL